VEPYIGEVRLFAGNFAPLNWAFCNGKLLAISENDALFALIGTTYGGDGQTTFALPDLRGRIPLSQGQGPGLSRRTVGESFGVEAVTLLTTQIPAHSHFFTASKTEGAASSPADTVFASNAANNFYAPLPDQGAQLEMLDPRTVAIAGGSQPHTNIMPSAAINYIIALFGIFPSQN
jgi:microcystin-dependent protein